MTREAYDSGRVKKSRQDSNREFITLLACISAIGKAIPPVLIYAGKSKDLWTTWMQDVNAEDGVHFGVSTNGWSNNEIGLSWLQQVFDRYTKPLRVNTKRLLIMDGHSSHVNMAFVKWADTHNIIVMILPPHTTHKLQPLDVGLFQPLSTAYSLQLDRFLQAGGFQVSMSKATFYPLFKEAWAASFTEKNIQAAFAKPGIWPLDPDPIIQSVTRIPPPKADFSSTQLKTPKSSKAIRHFQNAYLRSPTSLKRKKLFTTNKHLAAENEILRHTNKELIYALDMQKRKNKKKVRLDLSGEVAGKPVLYSPTKVAKAKAYIQEKEEQETQDEIAKVARKAIRAQNKESKEAKDAERQLAKELKAQIPAPQKSPTKKPITIAAKAKKVSVSIPKTVKALPKAKNLSNSPKKQVPKVVVSDEVENRVVIARGSKRSIVLPQRFRTTN